MIIDQLCPTGVSGHTYMDLSAGRHRIRLTARLRSNRRTRKMLNLRRFTIQPSQTTAPPPPAPPQVTTSADVINNCNVRLRFSADVPSTFRCRVNGGPWKPCKLQLYNVTCITLLCTLCRLWWFCSIRLTTRCQWNRNWSKYCSRSSCKNCSKGYCYSASTRYAKLAISIEAVV